jgi:uncharacterized membrane protein HdeD (DUF308 family)
MNKGRPTSNGDRLKILVGLILIGYGVFNLIDVGYTKAIGIIIFFGVLAILAGLLDPYLTFTKK